MTQKVPRLEFDQLEPKLRDTLRARVERLGYLGEFFKCTGHNPDVLRHFMEMTEALKKALPDRITEAVALSIAVKAGNDYERNQHERLSNKLGFGHDWIRAVESLTPGGHALMSAAEKAAQTYTVAAMDRLGKECGAEFEALVDALDARQAMAVAMLVGRYVSHAIIVNTLALVPPKPSIFDEGAA
jgi:alkylhydroperoxidase family enzyme